ncbi:RNase III inhibitor [Aeromonas schubertii]|uniref:macro domain-containing protein n=1 Tax=Aeromonas schubertii TaxID=652 RepID=UPI00067F2672|nr:macro domain-containing protein [Aeromonas schubertii]KUE81430.1 RNase III inhibitor [Aeromonas schubertii]
MGQLYLHQGDITRARVDAIVNAANPSLLGGGGVDGAIHRAAGPDLLTACQALPLHSGLRCPPGEARITQAGRLTARYIIHTVGPVYGHDPAPANTLARAYHNALTLALEHGCHSVALPAISCGVYGFPPAEAASIALATCRRPEFAELELHFYLLGDPMLALWQRAFAQGSQSDAS